MDSARPGNPIKFLSLKEAALKLAVSVDVLLKWNEQNILKPVITPEGEVGYTEEQITHFLKIRGSEPAKTPLFETNTAKHTQPGRAESVFDIAPEKHKERRKKSSLYQRFIHWIGKGFYEDEFVKNYLKSQVKD